ncbi:hypothetical protein QAD02_010447 [Eretmocerus hayati]|uniref:Uncharacterized protein n=1 Tax=Eretmocerus hayati TaxID=131215 RepID=A0ACC2NU23_9HYME|nr:hypothetical protein QAD02_010447 [Eretmocerus hayati]
MTPLLMAILCLATAGCANVTSDQQTSETQNESQVAILKQIRKLNDDGSYTYGYEAGDGSFKEQIAAVQGLPKNNRTTTTKRPNVTFATSTETATKSSVVQPIPRTRKTTNAQSVSSTPSASTDKPIFLRPKARPRFVINGQQRPLMLEDIDEVEGETIDEDSHLTKPGANEKLSSSLRRVAFTKRPLEHNLRPITEEFEAKEEEAKVASGNTLRRQLPESTTKAAPVVELESDHSDVFGGALSTSRPLFTTMSSPRPSPPRVADLRLERPRPSTPPKYERQESSSKAPSNHRTSDEDRNPAQQVLVRTTARAPVDAPREYLRGGEGLPPGAVLVPVQQGNGNLDEQEDPAYRQIPLSRLLLRQEYGRLLQNQQPLYSGTTDANVRYLTDSPPAAQETEEAAPRGLPPAPQPHPSYLVRQRQAYQQQVPYTDSRRNPLLRQAPLPPLPDEREYQNVDYPYRASLSLPPPPEAPNPIAPPLSRRDFQLLLRRLLVSQYGVQALSYPRSYLEDALYDQQPYPTFQPAYQAPLSPLGPRPEVAYSGEPMGAAPVAPPPQYSDRIPLRRPGYSRAINPLYQQNQYAEEYPDARYARRAYTQKYYTPEMTEDGQEILPPHIREALLLRMLQLVIGAPDKPLTAPNNLVMTTAIPSSTRYRKGPVRSVQIIGEDEGDDKEIRKKM